MGIFSNIMSKLGFGHHDDAAASATTTTAAAPSTAAPQGSAPGASGAPAAPSPSPMSEIDVVSKLDGLAASSSEKLNWKVSIVDLMKLLGLDSSLSARKELATELGCPADKMADSAQMNMWLHKTVMQKLAANGGNIPADLLN